MKPQLTLVLFTFEKIRHLVIMQEAISFKRNSAAYSKHLEMSLSYQTKNLLLVFQRIEFAIC